MLSTHEAYIKNDSFVSPVHVCPVVRLDVLFGILTVASCLIWDCHCLLFVTLTIDFYQ